MTLSVLNEDEKINEILKNIPEKLVHYGFQKRWHLVEAKWSRDISTREEHARNHDTLLSHALTSAAIAATLSDLLELDPKEKLMCVVASFFHDYGKSHEQYQMSLQLHQAGSYLDRQKIAVQKLIPLEEVTHLLRQIGDGLDELAEEVLSLALRNEAIESDKHLLDTLVAGGVKRGETLRDVVQLADLLASQKSIYIALKAVNRPSKGLHELLSKYNLTLTIHQVSIIRGTLTQLVHKSLEEAFTEKNWKPVAWYPEGTLYIGKAQDVQDVDFEFAKKMVQRNIRHFFEEKEIDLVKASFGSWTATLLSFPDFIFINSKTIRNFWNLIIGKDNYVKRPKPSDKDQKHVKNSKGYEDEDEIRAYTQPRQALFNLWRVYRGLNDFIDERIEQVLTDKTQKREIIEKLVNVRKKLGAPDELLKNKYSIATKPEQKFEKVGEALYQVFDPSRTLNLDDLINKAIDSLCSNIIDQFNEVQTFISLEPQIIDLTEKICTEIAYPASTSSLQVIQEVKEAYDTGKKKLPPLCFLCSRPSFEPGIASLVGSGPESFSNFLAAGTKIGGENKARICVLCKWEALIRRLYVKNVEEVIYVLPHMTQSRYHSQIVKTIIAQIIQGSGRDVGFNPIQKTKQWATIVLEKKLYSNLKHLKEFFKDVEEDARVRELEAVLKESYETVEDLLEAVDSTVLEQYNAQYKKKLRNHKDVARAIIQRNLAIKISDIIENEDDYFEKLKLASRFNYCYETPNYLMFFLETPLGKKDESEPTRILRKIFMGAILGVLFLSTVEFGEITNSIFVPLARRGYVRLPRHMTLLPIYRKVLGSCSKRFGLSFDQQLSHATSSAEHPEQVVHNKYKVVTRLHHVDYLPFPCTEDVIHKLAALIMLDWESANTDATFGKDNLLRIAQITPGRFLNRYVQKTGKTVPVKTLIDLLDIWSDSDEAVIKDLFAM